VTRARRTDYQDDDKGVAAGAAAGGVCPPNVTTPARPGQARPGQEKPRRRPSGAPVAHTTMDATPARPGEASSTGREEFVS
jgi:hypothetical protein